MYMYIRISKKIIYKVIHQNIVKVTPIVSIADIKALIFIKANGLFLIKLLFMFCANENSKFI